MRLDKFTEEHAGKTITIRQWDDMVREFGVDEVGDIIGPDDHLFSKSDNSGKKVSIHKVGHNGAAITITPIIYWESFYPWMTEEYWEPDYPDSCDKCEYENTKECPRDNEESTSYGTCHAFTEKGSYLSQKEIEALLDKPLTREDLSRFAGTHGSVHDIPEKEVDEIFEPYDEEESKQGIKDSMIDMEEENPGEAASLEDIIDDMENGDEHKSSYKSPELTQEDLDGIINDPFGNQLVLKVSQIASLVAEKNVAYGSSFDKSGDIIKVLYPDGVKPEQYKDMLLITRVLDKLFRIANRKDAFGENPWEDILGYALLASMEKD